MVIKCCTNCWNVGSVTDSVKIVTGDLRIFLKEAVLMKQVLTCLELLPIAHLSRVALMHQFIK